VTNQKRLKQTSLLVILVTALAACASVPQVTRLQTEAGSASPPYETILVVAVLKSFDSRRYLEKEVVTALEAKGTRAVAMTSLADSRTPLNRNTIIPLIEQVEADAVLVTQLTGLQTDAKLKNRNPQTSYNVRSTDYYNVFSVEVTEYVEPPAVQYEFGVQLRTDLFSADSKESVWAIAQTSSEKTDINGPGFYSGYADQAAAIVRALRQDKLVAK